MLKSKCPVKASKCAFIRAVAPALALLLSPVAAAGVFAAVPVDINSGDPAFPFPQFLPYTHPDGDALPNLGTRNPAGVTHAEMEKSIRDAYQIMMNRAEYYNNMEFRGKKYILFRDNGAGGANSCSESSGYGLLAAAMMADKTTFDGLWLFIHDVTMFNVARYRDGAQTSPGYNYSKLFQWKNDAGDIGDNSATDGDVDIALALMLAYRQWGEFMGIKDSKNVDISYKAALIEVLKGMTDTLTYAPSGNGMTLVSGDIGFDGYFKGGDSQSELTGWARNVQNLLSVGISRRVETAGPKSQYFDYAAPAYFREFADYLQAENASAYGWNISQFRRAEASSDWLMGKLIGQNPKNIPMAGDVAMTNDTTPVFTEVGEGEDFRAPWRTILNYVWHGDPVYTWDPVEHNFIRNRSNTYQRDAGQRLAKFLWDRRPSPWGVGCEKTVGKGAWWGPSVLKQHYSPQGEEKGVWTLNWVHGTGAPAAVAARDTNLMAEMYRQAELEWDVAEAGDRYLTSKPVYFHGFFRLLGMNVLTGNHHAPMNMKRAANMKVYLDVDKTFAFEDDTITYTIDYRNYGADTAKGVQIINRLHSDFVFVSGTGSPSYSASSNTVTWNIGPVPGFKTSGGVEKTKGSVTLKVVIPRANLKRYENKVDITCTNGTGWTSNEYPNKISSVMKRNGVDIAKRALRVEHSVYRDTVNPGMTATYTIDFENSAEAGWMNGGRPGVNFSYAHNGTAASAGEHKFMLRVFHDAHEAYIDYGNYRISYYLSDPATGDAWSYRVDQVEVPEAEKGKFKFQAKDEMPGEDSKGKWNQRLILQIADPENDKSRTDTNWGTMAAPTQFLLNYYKLNNRVHRGISTPFKGVWAVHKNYVNRDWGGDWSYNPRVSGNTAGDDMEDWGYPISPDFTEASAGDTAGKPVTALHRKLCATSPTITVDNILIEEWDGYIWRRVFGNGPLPGREVNNVVIRDTLPAGVTYIGLKEPTTLNIAPKVSVSNGVTVITWEISKLSVSQKGKIQYSVRADTVLGAANKVIKSRVWASADNESATQSTATLVVTRDSLPPAPPEPTTMSKKADKTTYLPGDTVNYTITYKQTHGYPVKSGSSSEWEPVTAGGAKTVSAAGDTITLDRTANMYHKLSYGTNGSIGGTAAMTTPDQEFYLFARSDNNNKKVELYFNIEWDGLHVKINSNGKETVVSNPFAVDKVSMVFNYKVEFSKDSLLLWINDTSTAIPSYKTGGIDVQAGYAGVRSVKDYAIGRLIGWNSHFDLAYDVTIRDTIPFGVRYIGPATGSINTGTLSPKPLTGSVSGDVIAWPVVSGSGNPLGANDSLTVTWRGIVDTSKTGSVVNTAYADLAGHPKDAVGAQARSRFSLVKLPDEPPPDLPGVDTLQSGLAVKVDPPGCMFAGSIKVTLSSLPGASIWYTRNGMEPDTTSITTQRYTGQPIELFTRTTLKAVAYADGFEPSATVTHEYEPVNTVPIRFAVFYDDVGDGLAHGVKLVISPAWASSLEPSVVKAHPELLSLPGLPVTDSLRFVGVDTIVIPFRNGVGVDPLGPNTKLIVKDPPLPDSRYANAHGYLAACELNIMDGVVPVITEAVYYPTLKGGELQGGVEGDTLAVTFNKLPGVHDSGELVPFVFSYAGGTYELELRYAFQDKNTFYFEVAGMSGRNPVAAPSDGDSIRIKVGGRGIWLNDTTIVQQNANNTAVALKVRYPDLKYTIKAGPSPSADTVRVTVTISPFLPSAFAKLAPKAVIFDRMGSVVAASASGKGITFREDGERYVLVWDGCNRKGRRVGTGTYRIVVTITDQDGGKRAFGNNVYILRKK